MAIPEQIRKQTAAVQELYKQLNGEPAGEENADANASADTAPIADESVESSAPPSPVYEQKSGDDKAVEDTVLQKYKTLQGMYNAEVPRLHQQNREMQQRVQQMEQLLATFSQPNSQPQMSAPATEKYVTDEDVAEYGDSLDMMRKVSKEESYTLYQRIASLENMLKQLQSNVVPQVQAVAQRQAVTAEQQFWSDLSTTVPNWREVNDNDAFQSWLLDIDPLTGITRQTYLEDAQRSQDVRRVSNFFRTWLEMSGQAPVAQSSGRTSGSSSELEKQVSPGRSRSAGTTSSSKSKMYSPNDIAKFFDDIRAGKYKGRDQDRRRTEHDIFAAQREGRIQPNA